MTVIPASLARAQWAKTLDEAKREPVTVTEHGRETVTIMDVSVARAALEALARSTDGVAERTAGAFIPIESVAMALRELGSDGTWARELADTRDLAAMEDPWATRR
ncbi:MAG: type II toxin-antitoxin system prevent-host-death family antitoxin [Humibacter sp.]